MTEDTILGMTREEFKESVLTSLVMSAVSFGMVFVGMIVKNYFKETIE